MGYLSLDETWLNHSIGDCELEIPNYTCHRFNWDLGSGRRGGGSLLTSGMDLVEIEPSPEQDRCTYVISIDPCQDRYKMPKAY